MEAPDPTVPINSDAQAISLSHGAAGKVVYPVLDGWRGISILLVLATHMLPLGRDGIVNAATGLMGMSLFFTLSGFLITISLLEHPGIGRFLIRRICRIFPLAWLYACIALAMQKRSAVGDYLAYFTFSSNYQPSHVTPITSHYWSLCVEVHFYIFIAILVAIGNRRALKLLPWICLAVTAHRIMHGAWIDNKTEYRVDEILAGTIVALVHHGEILPGLKRVIGSIWLPVLAIGLILSSYPPLHVINYARPYFGASLVASTLWYPPKTFGRILRSRFLAYIAIISYALYVVHPATMYGWLGTGHGLNRYLIKRPLSFVLTFALAHLSTFYYEKPWTDWGKRITSSPARSKKDQVVLEIPTAVAPAAGIEPQV